MKIGDSISSYYGLTGRFGQQSGRGQSGSINDIAGVARQSGPSLQSSGIPSSISSTMWLSQAEDETTVSGKPATDANDALYEEFSKWAKMTPAEKIRAQVLESMGLTEESLQAMQPEERAAVEKQIAEEIKRQLGGNDGKSDDETPPVDSLPV